MPENLMLDSGFSFFEIRVPECFFREYLLFFGNTVITDSPCITPISNLMGKEDKLILIIATLSVLLVFMDRQAKKQQEFIKANVRKISSKEFIGTLESKDREKENISDTLENRLHRQKEIQEVIQKIQNLLKEEKGKFIQRSGVLPALPLDEKQNTVLKLYYPRYRENKETEIQEVIRTIKGKVTPYTALKILQKGPLKNEKGYVNAFFENITIKDMIYEEDTKSIHIFFENSFYTENSPVMTDRLQQVCRTVRQFPDIEIVVIWLDTHPRFVMDKCNIL